MLLSTSVSGKCVSQARLCLHICNYRENKAADDATRTCTRVCVLFCGIRIKAESLILILKALIYFCVFQVEDDLEMTFVFLNKYLIFRVSQLIPATQW